MRATELQSVGFSALQVLAIVGTMSQTFTAAGTTQATATALSTTWTYVTSGSENNGAILPAGAGVSDEMAVCNSLSVGINVYPPVGYKLNGRTANYPVYLPANTTGRFICVDGNNYMAIF